jgi:hypothetical protein
MAGGKSAAQANYFHFPSHGMALLSDLFTHIFGVLAQLVERLNGIEEVRGSNPLGSKYL